MNNYRYKITLTDGYSFEEVVCGVNQMMAYEELLMVLEDADINESNILECILVEVY